METVCCEKLVTAWSTSINCPFLTRDEGTSKETVALTGGTTVVGYHQCPKGIKQQRTESSQVWRKPDKEATGKVN